MLDKTLDKLRDKTLTFGCITIKADGTSQRTSGIGGAIPVNNIVLGHPLTRGRIEYLHHTKNDNTEEYWNILSLLRDNPELYNQSELERQTHEKRPELKELLIQFSNYL